MGFKNISRRLKSLSLSSPCLKPGASRSFFGELAAWLRRFGQRLLEGEHDETAATDAVASLQELAQRLVLLGRIGSGELSEVARQIGREILTG
jgi:hypothetical protein